MTQLSNALLELSDDDWSAICQTVPGALTKTSRSRLLVNAIIRMMVHNLTWAEATPEGFGATTLYATVNTWAYKDVIGPLVEILENSGLTDSWNLSEVEPATPGKRPQLKQFIGLKLLELRGDHPPVFYIKDWSLTNAVTEEEFVLTPELKARNSKLRSKVRRRKKKIEQTLQCAEELTSPIMDRDDSLLIAA
jgi:hypothetical protein